MPPVLGVKTGKPALEVTRCRKFDELALTRAPWHGRCGPGSALACAKAEKDDELYSLVNRTIDRLSVAAGQVIVLGPTPVLAHQHRIA